MPDVTETGVDGGRRSTDTRRDAWRCIVDETTAERLQVKLLELYCTLDDDERDLFVQLTGPTDRPADGEVEGYAVDAFIWFNVGSLMTNGPCRARPRTGWATSRSRTS
jgi:hypothetical protein